jgi:hypothetical protein
MDLKRMSGPTDAARKLKLAQVATLNAMHGV